MKFHVACRLWLHVEYEQAAARFCEVLELDADDPDFARYWLAACLFQSESLAELDSLLRQRDDDSGIWRFARALRAF